MEQRELLMIGTRELRNILLNQHPRLRSIFRIQRLQFTTIINLEEVQTMLEKDNRMFDVILVYSGQYLYPLKRHADHLCLEKWQLRKTADYMEKLIKILSKHCRLVVVADTHPRILNTPMQCNKFNVVTQFRGKLLIKQLIRDRIPSNVRFLLFANMLHGYYYRSPHSNIPWQCRTIDFAQRFLNDNEVDLTEEGNRIVQNLTATALLKIAQNYFFYYCI